MPYHEEPVTTIPSEHRHVCPLIPRPLVRGLSCTCSSQSPARSHAAFRPLRLRARDSSAPGQTTPQHRTTHSPSSIRRTLPPSAPPQHLHPRPSPSCTPPTCLTPTRSPAGPTAPPAPARCTCNQQSPASPAKCTIYSSEPVSGLSPLHAPHANTTSTTGGTFQTLQHLEIEIQSCAQYPVNAA